jgi:hypothetical protein
MAVRRGLDDKWYDSDGKVLPHLPSLEELAEAYPGSADSISLLHKKIDRMQEDIDQILQIVFELR